jgi:hypothetical protein
MTAVRRGPTSCPNERVVLPEDSFDPFVLMVGASPNERWDFITVDDSGEEMIWDTFHGYVPFRSFQVCTKGCESRSDNSNADADAAAVALTFTDEAGLESYFAPCPDLVAPYKLLLFNELDSPVRVFFWDASSKQRRLLLEIPKKKSFTYASKRCLYLEAEQIYDGAWASVGTETIYPSGGDVIAYFSENTQFER